MKKLDALEREITGGTTATVALVYKSKLYVANVGKLRIWKIDLICNELFYWLNEKRYLYI